MPDGLDAVVLAEVKCAVQARAQGRADGVVLRDAEGVELVCWLRLHLVCFRIIGVFRLLEEPVLRIADRRGETDVFQQLEVRQANLEVV